MTSTKSCEKAAEFIKSKFGAVAETALVLGSGQGGIAQAAVIKDELAFEEIPGFVSSTVKGHNGKLLHGTLAGKPVIIQSGRLHYYEGHSLYDVVFPTRTLALCGVKKFIMMNAAGGISKSFPAGSLMLISDHINNTGQNPLVGAYSSKYGERFIDLSECYDAGLRKTALAAAKKAGIVLKEGVYLWTCGPSYETPAEIKYFGLIGADAVGMSTVPEVIAARQMGARVLGLSLITNKAAGLGAKLSHEEVVTAAKRAENEILTLISEFFSLDLNT